MGKSVGEKEERFNENSKFALEVDFLTLLRFFHDLPKSFWHGDTSIKRYSSNKVSEKKKTNKKSGFLVCPSPLPILEITLLIYLFC